MTAKVWLTNHRLATTLVPVAVLDVAPAKLVDQVERELMLSDQDIAQALGVDLRTLDRWRAGTYPQRETREKLSALATLTQRLSTTFNTPEARRAWLHDDSRYLGGLAPIDALRAGRFDRLDAALEALDSGVFL